jgi:hypothetical protein
MLDDYQYCHTALELSMREITQQIVKDKRHLLKSMPAVHGCSTAIPAAGNRPYNQLCNHVNIERRNALDFLWHYFSRRRKREECGFGLRYYGQI